MVRASFHAVLLGAFLAGCDGGAIGDKCSGDVDCPAALTCDMANEQDEGTCAETPCTSDEDCRAGAVCDLTGGADSGVCASAPAGNPY